MKVTKQKEGYDPVTVDYYLGEDIEDPKEWLDWAQKEFGEAVCKAVLFEGFLRKVRAKLASLVTKHTEEEIQQIVDNWKIGVIQRGTGMKVSVRKYLEEKRKELGDEEFIKFLKEELEG